MYLWEPHEAIGRVKEVDGLRRKKSPVEGARQSYNVVWKEFLLVHFLFKPLQRSKNIVKIVRGQVVQEELQVGRATARPPALLGHHLDHFRRHKKRVRPRRAAQVRRDHPLRKEGHVNRSNCLLYDGLGLQYSLLLRLINLPSKRDHRSINRTIGVRI